jgi:Fe-S cluster biogenesis protein NfuA
LRREMATETSTTEPGQPSVTDAAKKAMEAGIAEAIDAIRPALQVDGGDIVFNELDDEGRVHVTLVGACGTCPVSTMTLKAGVERIIMDRVPGVTEVVAE